MSDAPSDTGPTRASIPIGALIGILVVALVGFAMLGYALISLFNARGAALTPTSPSAAVASPAAPTRVAVIPTVTPAPPATATAEPSPTAAFTEAAPATPAGAVLTIVQGANVRAGPGVNYGIVGGLQAGSTVEVVGRDSSAAWYVVNYLGGRGWVAAQLAQYTGDINALPVITAPPPPTATPPPPTATPPPPPTATRSGVVVGSSRGVRGDYFRLQTTAREFGVNQDIWFEFKVTNTSGNTLPYRCLGAKVPGGQAQCSWGSTPTDALGPNAVIEWNDHINIGTPGAYTLVLGICYLGDTVACQNSGSNGWEYLSDGIQITVR